MEKTVILKSLLLSLIPSGYFIWTHDMHTAIFTLIIIAILDVFTGVIKAGYCGDFKTSTLWDKTLRKIIKLTIAITLGYFLDIGIGHSGISFWSFLFGTFIYFCFFFSSVEAASILENLNDMGLDLPNDFVKNLRRNVSKAKCKALKKKKNEKRTKKS